jgi:hypothetical protein
MTCHRGGEIKFLVLSLADANFSKIAAISTPNKRAYAERYGYDFRLETELLDKGRAPSWNKILYLARYLPRYDWIFWTDADSLIMNPALSLASLVAGVGEDLIFAKYEGRLQAGQFLIRNSPFSLDFLARVYAQLEFINHVHWEQAAIIALLKNPRDAAHVRFVEPRLLNSFIHPSLRTYKPGDFIAHFAGLSGSGDLRARRLALMKEYEPPPANDAPRAR